MVDTMPKVLNLKQSILVELYGTKTMNVAKLINETAKYRENGLKISPVTMSIALSELEEGLFVSSVRNGSDKREKYYFLTELGRKEAIIAKARLKMESNSFLEKINNWSQIEEKEFWKMFGIDISEVRKK